MVIPTIIIIFVSEILLLLLLVLVPRMFVSILLAITQQAVFSVTASDIWQQISFGLHLNFE